VKPISRRDFVAAAVGTSVAYLFDGKLTFAQSASAADQQRVQQVASKLPSFEGVFVFDESVRRAMATDFGHYVHKMPLGVLFPKNLQDVQKAVRFANAQQVKVGMRGTGGAAYGQSQVGSGIVINSSSLARVSWIAPDLVDAEPGALWKDIVELTLTRGMAPPVVPDSLFLSVGGTLNAGGLGDTSYRLGAQVDHVVELDVVTGSGDFVTCSLSREAELFQMALAGMGQCAIIVRARLRLLPAPQDIVVRSFYYSDRRAFLTDLGMLANSEPHGAISGELDPSDDGKAWTPVINVMSFEAAEPTWTSKVKGKVSEVARTQTFSAYLNRFSEHILGAQASGAWFVPHVFMHFFLPADQTLPMVNYLLDTPGASLGAAWMAVFPMIGANFKQPLRRMPDGPLSYHMRIYRQAKQEDSPEHLQMLALNQKECLPRIFASGGKVYLPFSPLLDSSQRAQQFGHSTWERFEKAKAKYDPKTVLTPGAGLFPS
jgi:cytokinin dehydrogenase